MKKLTILGLIFILCLPALILAKPADRDLGYAYCENLKLMSVSLNELADIYKELNNVYLLLEAEKVAGANMRKSELYRSAAADIDRAEFKLRHYIKATADANYDTEEVESLYKEGKKVYDKIKK